MNVKKTTTQVIHSDTGRQGDAHRSPVFLTSSFVFNDAEQMRAAFADELAHDIYSRFDNPNVSELVQRLAVMEEAEAGIATASGMAAIYAVFGALLEQGDHIVCSRSIFGSTHTLITKWLPKWGVTHSFVDPENDDWAGALRPETRLIFAETPANPGLDIVDLDGLGTLGSAHNIPVVIDNCFATPALQQPLKHGASLSIHSATKFIDGQGRVLGGAVLGSKALIEKVYQFCRVTGPALSPFNAWVLSNSLETLALRMEKHSENALKTAQWLEDSTKVMRVRYPFLSTHPGYTVARKQMKAGGGLVAFELPGGLEQGKRFLDALELCSLTANLGDTRTIATHPASTTHAKLSEDERLVAGITPGMVRLSIGLEDTGDIINDIDNALERSTTK